MANVCDYSTMKHYNSGEFNRKYKTKLEGNIVKINKEIIEDETILKSFMNESYETYVTINNLVLYRVYGRFKRKNQEKIFGAKLTGAFATTEFAESVYDVKMRMALDQLWGNPKMFEAKILLPTETTINIGRVAPVTSKSGTVFTGGADQILLPKDWPAEWVIGYRRVSMRQLQQVPTFKEGIPKDEIMNVEDLYKPRTCPMCGSINNIIVYHGEDSDYGEDLCEDGTTCIARYHCLESDCLYYW